MSNFCPEWVYGICCAKTGFDFLSTNNSINMIAKKFAKELSNNYDEIKFEEIVDSSEKILQFLSEINAGEEAANIINDYIYHRVNFNSNGSIRKINSMFSSAFDGNKEKDYNSDKTLKVFRATTYSIRNGVIDKATPGWTITDVEDIDWLGEVFEQNPDINDI